MEPLPRKMALVVEAIAEQHSIPCPSRSDIEAGANPLAHFNTGSYWHVHGNEYLILVAHHDPKPTDYGRQEYYAVYLVWQDRFYVLCNGIGAPPFSLRGATIVAANDTYLNVTVSTDNAFLFDGQISHPNNWEKMQLLSPSNQTTKPQTN